MKKENQSILLAANVVAAVVIMLIFVFFTGEINPLKWHAITKVAYVVASIGGIVSIYNSWKNHYKK
jgi:K+-transporting ATPase c subunit